MAHALDIIGDIHGELPALRALGQQLGYDVDHGWSHQQRRFPIFLGDLVDRGAHSLEVSELVMGLVAQRRAACIMGNHEYNLVAHHLNVPGYQRPKRSNTATIAAITASPARWAPVLRFFQGLPVGINLPDLRLIHACWNIQSLALTAPLLGMPAPPTTFQPVDTLDHVLGHVSVRSPFALDGLIPGLPGDTLDEDADAPHEVLLKGFEVPTPTPFADNDGKVRHRVRAVWWEDGRHLVLTDKTQVFGHYWNTPPLDGHFAPPHPSGHPKLREWGDGMAARCPPSGSIPLQGDLACIDFNGITRASQDRACVGALRWPERDIVWASAEKTASANAGD
jgi:hypothetical protein